MVDVKFNSIWAAEIAARAESKGYPGEVFRAMVVQDAELWIDEDGRVSSSRQGSTSEQIDTRSTILTIRASQMIKAKMAVEFTGKPSELGELLGIEDWSHAKGVGEKIMLSSSRERVRLGKKMSIALKVFKESTENLERDDPRKHNDYYWEISRNRDGAVNFNTRNLPDPDSLRNWQQRSRLSINHCDRLLAALTEIANVSKKASKIGALHLGVPSDIGDETFKIITDARIWLQGHRLQIPTNLLMDKPWNSRDPKSRKRSP